MDTGKKVGTAVSQGWSCMAPSGKNKLVQTSLDLKVCDLQRKKFLKSLSELIHSFSKGGAVAAVERNG